MSRFAELMMTKRAAQIAVMEGREPADMRGVDDELARVRPPRRSSVSTSSARLSFTTHARRRMAQRGLSVGDVYAIWRNGEPSGEDTVYTVTREAMSVATRRDASRLRRLEGAAIVVMHDGRGFGLRTVVHDGRDTKMLRNWR